MKQISIIEAVDIINANVDNLKCERDECYALRGDDCIPKSRFAKSYNRPDGKRTTQIRGVCAIYVTENGCGGDWSVDVISLEQLIVVAKKYGNHIYLLQGDNDKSQLPNDEINKEIILSNHKIIAEII